MNANKLKNQMHYVVCPKCRTVAIECPSAKFLAEALDISPTCEKCGTEHTVARHKPQTAKRRGGMDPALYFTPDEVATIQRYVADLAKQRKSREAQRTHLIIEILAYAGIRSQELCSLQMRDLPTPGGPKVLYVRRGKGNVARPVVVSERLVKLIDEYSKAFRAGASPESTLFENRHGHQMDRNSLYGKLRRVGNNLGLRTKLSAHRLRRSYGVKLYGQQRDLLLVKQQLGHANVQTTQIYAETLPADAESQIEEMG